jgi:malyl-CoA/(S)-citramalyl-CoA lyase
MRSPRDFFRPLALGAPQPLRDIPVRPSRMIHFFDPSNPKMVEKAPGIAKQVDILLGNLEDAIAIDNKEAAREGFIRIARDNDFGDTQLWTRINSLDSPWFLEDITRIVTEVGDKVDVIMLPKIQGAWDIHFADQLLAQLEARAGLKRPIQLHCLLETALGVANVEEIANASPRIQGMSLGPADLAASRRMKTTRIGGVLPTRRTCGTTPSPAWWMPASVSAPCPSMVPLAPSMTRRGVKTNSAMPFSWAASVPGHFTPAR